MRKGSWLKLWSSLARRLSDHRLSKPNFKNGVIYQEVQSIFHFFDHQPLSRSKSLYTHAFVLPLIATRILPTYLSHCQDDEEEEALTGSHFLVN